MWRIGRNFLSCIQNSALSSIFPVVFRCTKVPLYYINSCMAEQKAKTILIDQNLYRKVAISTVSVMLVFSIVEFPVVQQVWSHLSV